MARIRVSVLGPIDVEVDGARARLTPLTKKLLIRLVAAESQAVSVDSLRRDVWGLADRRGRTTRRDRNEVQKRILELRRIFEPVDATPDARIIRTEMDYSGSQPQCTYRLVLEREQLDSIEFAGLVSDALHAAPASSTAMLTRAVGLWRGTPLAEAGEAEFRAVLARRLQRLHNTALDELVRLHAELGRLDLALPIAEAIASQRPDDPDAVKALLALRDRARELRRDELLRCELPGLRTALVVSRGDVFDQSDANVVVGFTDTFDVATADDVVISRDSVQGQLLDRLFAGDARALDRELRRGLRTVAPVAIENTKDKPKGKRTRYPVGTAFPIRVKGRQVFATAYSRMGNDLMARSDPRLLRQSLELLWASVARHGHFKPVAITVVGSGMARVVQLSWEELVIMIIDTYVRACRDLTAVAPELRIVIRPAELNRIRISEVAHFVDLLDQNGAHPDDAPRAAAS